MTNAQQEMNCLKKLMEDKNPELLVKIDNSMFGNDELSKIFSLIKKFYINNGDWPGWDVLRGQVTQRCQTEEKSRFLLSLLGQIQERDIAGLTDEILTEEMQTTGKCRRILESIGEITQAAEQKDMELVIGLYQKGWETVFSQEENSLDDNDMASMAGKKIRFNFNHTGIKPIDDRGGLIEGGLFGIAGESKAGKSLMALQWAVHNYLQHGESVGYFSYEQGRYEIRARLLSNLSNIDIGKITTDALTDEEVTLLRLSELKFVYIPVDDMDEFCASRQNLEDEEFWEAARSTYELRPNKFLIFDDPFDWDLLGLKMELLRSTKDIGFFVIDYPYLVPRGHTDRQLQSWEYNLLQSRKLKHFARSHTSKGRPTRVVVLAQYDSKEDNLRYVRGLINDLDMLIKIYQDKEDKELGTVTCSHGGIYRNFLSIPDKPFLEDFKLFREFECSRFVYMEF